MGLAPTGVLTTLLGDEAAALFGRSIRIRELHGDLPAHVVVQRRQVAALREIRVGLAVDAADASARLLRPKKPYETETAILILGELVRLQLVLFQATIASEGGEKRIV